MIGIYNFVPSTRYVISSTHAFHLISNTSRTVRMVTGVSFPKINKISTQFCSSIAAKTAKKPRSKLADPIKLTEKAAARIKELLEQKDNAIGVRIGVKRRGCNGYSYTMNYVVAEEDQDTISSRDRDEVVACHGVQVFVDPKAVFFIVGTEMDFIETDVASEFTFTNPNSKGECGCGESFNV